MAAMARDEAPENLQPDAGPGNHCQAKAQVGSGTLVAARPTEGERGGSLSLSPGHNIPAQVPRLRGYNDPISHGFKLRPPISF